MAQPDPSGRHCGPRRGTSRGHARSASNPGMRVGSNLPAGPDCEPARPACSILQGRTGSQLPPSGRSLQGQPCASARRSAPAPARFHRQRSSPALARLASGGCAVPAIFSRKDAKARRCHACGAAAFILQRWLWSRGRLSLRLGAPSSRLCVRNLNHTKPRSHEDVAWNAGAVSHLQGCQKRTA